MHKEMRKLHWLLSVVLTLALSTVVSAQAWAPFEFNTGGHYEYHVQKFEYTSWNDTVKEQEHFYTVSFLHTGAVTENGQRLFDVTTSTRRMQAEPDLKQELSFGFSNFGNMTFGNPFEYGVILIALEDMDFEIGERTTVAGMGRVSIVERATVAGRTGLLVRYEAGDASNRRVAIEWVIDDKLPLPLSVREYDKEGRVTHSTTLLKYSDK